MKSTIIIISTVCLLMFSACHTAKKTAKNVQKTESETMNKKLFQREWTLVAISDISKNELAQMQNKPTLNIQETISGFGGCNRLLGGAYVLKGNNITISNLASTKKLCIGAGQKIEDIFLSILNNAKTYKMEGANLYLYTNDNRQAEFIAYDKE